MTAIDRRLTSLAPLPSFFIARQRKYKLTHLYDPSKNSIYYYTYGVNWRAAVAWACGVFPVFPGFIHYVANGGLGNYNAVVSETLRRVLNKID